MRGYGDIKQNSPSSSDISALDWSHQSPHHPSQGWQVGMGSANPPQNAERLRKLSFPSEDQSSTKPSLRQALQSPTQPFMSCNSTML